MKNKKAIFLFTAIAAVGGLIIFWLWQNYSERRLEIISAELEAVSNQYDSTINSYRLVSRTLYDEVVNTKEVAEDLRTAKANPEQQAAIRSKLYAQFKDSYERLKAKNYKQFNLYLSDGVSFLNMYKPDDFGNPADQARPSIQAAVSSGRYQEGFEEARLFNGFRYIFPIIDNGQVAGFLETSVSLSTFQREMSDIFPLTYRFLLKKSVVGDTVYGNDVRSYNISQLNRDYFTELETDASKRADTLSPEMIDGLDKALKDNAKKLMDGGQRFVREINMDGINYLVSFLPINNFSGTQSAYLDAYRQSDELYFLKNDLYVRLVFALALMLVILFLTYYIYDSQQKLLDAGERLKHITTAMGEGLLVLNNQRQVIFFNPAAESLSGFSLEEVLGHKYKEKLKFVSEDGKKPNNGFIGRILKGLSEKTKGKDVFIRQKTGDLLPISVSASPLKIGTQVAGCIVVFRDVTAEREVDKAKTEFVSLASHQLKTPLSAVNWYAEMLLDGDAGELNARQKEFLKEIAGGNQRMAKLVNSLLNVSRIDMGTLSITPEPVDLSAVFDSVIEEQQFAISAKQLELKKSYEKDLPRVNLDPNLIRIVIQNLISNAVKYTRENGKIEVELRRQSGDVLVKVADNGYGIPKLEQPEIFKKLFRADNVKSKKVEGTGLGLYVAKAVVEAFGGKIWFESVEDKGTSFYITLPLIGAKKRLGTKGLEGNT